MTKEQKLVIIIESLEKELSDLRDIKNDKFISHENYMSCIHQGLDGLYTCGVWPKGIKASEKEQYSTVSYNDIVHGSNRISGLEQDDFCRVVQSHLCILNEIEGY